MKDIRTFNKLQLKELSSNILLNFEGEIPITTLRINSFIKNTNIDDDDILLIAYYKNNKLASYFGILPDIANNNEKFYWNTGWRANNSIDKRAATIVLYKALSIYGNRMILNHLTPHTKKIIDSTKKFEPIKKINGTKFFFKFVLAEILVAKKPKLSFLKSIFKLIDFTFNIFITIFYTFFKNNIKYTKIIDSIDSDCENFINTIKNEFVKDSVKNINHALKYKWLITNNSLKDENEKYFFSLKTNVFENYILKISIKNKIIGVMHIVNRDNNFKLYYSYINTEYTYIIANELYSFLQKNNAKTFLSFDIVLNKYISKQKFIYLKNTVQFYTFSNNVSHFFNSNQQFQAGFGDALYT